VGAIEELCGEGFFGQEPVVVQTGHTSEVALIRCRGIPFLPSEEFDRHLKDASVVVTHGGTTQLLAIRFGKVPVAMPRRRQYGEHVNDHQLQLVQALAEEGLVVPAYESAELPRAIVEARCRRSRPIPISRMVTLVAEALDDIGKRRAM
jgi:UDP-N-acetylglucosamine transferase subunit ALG13